MCRYARKLGKKHYVNDGFKLLINLMRYSLALLMTVSSVSFAEELPKMSSISAGKVEISQSLNELVVRQTSDSGIINWDSFNVSRGAGVIFEQPSEKSITLNNILSAAPALIDGKVTAPGHVFFSSPSGIVFGENARVNVNTLLATNHRIERVEANKFDLKNPGLGQVVNLGAINAKSAYLIGRDVLNAGKITSSNGSIGLVAASDVRVSFDAAGLLTATIVADDVLGTVTNTGTLDAGERGRIDLKASASEEIVASTINNDATSASALISENGVLKLVNNSGEIKGKSVSLSAEPNGRVSVSGIISADNTSGTGGLVTITGKEVTLEAGAIITATGYSGGGKILIGGDWQGAGDLFQSTYTNVESQVIVGANATTSGDGGTIVAWSDINNPNSITSVAGSLTAKGGSISGNGGQIETSGAKLNISDQIYVDTTTFDGSAGTWLLDPYDYFLDAADLATLSTALNSTDVSIATTSATSGGSTSGHWGKGNLIFENDFTYSGANNRTLTLTADNDIVLQGAITASGAGSLSLVANATSGKILVDDNITSNGGSITFSSPNVHFQKMGDQSISTGGGAINFGTSNIIGVETSGALEFDSGSGDLNLGSGTLSTSTTSYSFASNTLSNSAVVAGGSHDTGIDIVSGRNYSMRIYFWDSWDGENLKLKVGTTEYFSGNRTHGSGFSLPMSTSGTITWSSQAALGRFGWGDQYVNLEFDASNSGDLLLITTLNQATNDESAQLQNVFESSFTQSTVSNGRNLILKSTGGQITGTKAVSSFDDVTLSGSYVETGDVSIIADTGLNTSSITSDGKITLSTKTGNLVVAGNLSTTSTATDAIVVNAGKDTAAGTKTGGNVTISGSPTLSVGTGGRATIYTGGISESTGVHTFVGGASGQSRYNSDESASNFTTALGTGGYVVYREQPTVTFTASNDSKTYDASTYSGGNGYTVSGLQNSDAEGLLSGSISYVGSAQGAKNVGSYGITPTGITDTLGYAVSFVSGTLTVGKAGLTVTAADDSKTYDTLAYSGDNGYSISGFVGGEGEGDLSGTVAIGGSSQGAINAGSYALTPSGVSSGNYTITFVPGTLTVGKAGLTVTANSGTSDAGAAFSGDFGYEVEGFVGGEGEDVLSGSVAIGGSSQGAFNAGEYDLTISGVSSNNYDITFVDGKLVLIEKPKVEVSSPKSTKSSTKATKTVKFSGSSKSNLKAGELSLGENTESSPEESSDIEETASNEEEEASCEEGEECAEETEVASVNNGDQEAGAGGSDENENEISGTLGNQGNDKDVGNAGGARGNAAPKDEEAPVEVAEAKPVAEEAPVEEPSEEEPPVPQAREEEATPENNGDQEAGAGGSDENDNEISGTLGNQGNDKDVGNAGGDRGNKPPAEDPPAEDPPAEDPPAEDPPAEDPPAEDPPAEDPPAEDPPAEDPPAEDPPAEDPPAEDPPAEDPPAEDPPAEDPPAEDPPAEDPPSEDPPAEDPPAEDPPAEDPPAEDPPAEDPPAEDPPAEDPQVITPVFVEEENEIATGEERNIIARELEPVELSQDTFIYQVSEDTFQHADPTAEITISVEMVDGSTLPAWIQYDEQELSIIGRRPEGTALDIIEIKLIGRDQFGDSAETIVRIQKRSN